MVVTLGWLAGCTEYAERVYFDGRYYPASADRVSRDARERFTVSVRRVDQGIDGARKAGRHEATRYCIQNFGTSRIDWQLGPEAEAALLRTPSGNLLLKGECATW
jgi:hypothetical protein